MISCLNIICLHLYTPQKEGEEEGKKKAGRKEEVKEYKEGGGQGEDRETKAKKRTLFKSMSEAKALGKPCRYFSQSYIKGTVSQKIRSVVLLYKYQSEALSKHLNAHHKILTLLKGQLAIYY